MTFQTRPTVPTAPAWSTETPGAGHFASIPIFHASLLGGGLFERNVVLRGERPQAASDDSDRAEFGPGGVHHIGGGGALLAQKSVLTIPTLQIVLCAGYGDLHCFPGQRTVPLRTPKHRQPRAGEQLGGLLPVSEPLLGPSPLPEDAVRGVLAADFRAGAAAGVAAVQDRALSTRTSKQPALKLSQPPGRGSGRHSFPGSDLGCWNRQRRAVGRLPQAPRAEHSRRLRAARPEAHPPCLNAGLPLGDGSHPRGHSARRAASTLWTAGRTLSRHAWPRHAANRKLGPGDRWSPSA